MNFDTILPILTAIISSAGTLFYSARQQKFAERKHQDEMAIMQRKLEEVSKINAQRQMSEEMKILLDANNEFREEIRKDLLSAKKELEEANNKIDKLEVLIVEKNRLITEQSNMIIELQHRITSLSNRIKELEK